MTDGPTFPADRDPAGLASPGIVPVAAEPGERDALRPELTDAERVLHESLGEVCATDPRQADTGEMIRLDEMLAIASDAAKRAVSLRRRLHQETGRSARTASRGTRARGRATPPRATPAPGSAGHRTFRDSKGVTWSVWAVQPQTATTARRAGLRGSFAAGWLAFVCDLEKRRLSPVPDGWEGLDDQSLERLCGEAEVARRDAATRTMPPVVPDPAPPDAGREQEAG